MSDLIDREDAIQAAKHAWAKGIEPSQYIEIIPSVDAVEVVRCKYCKHFKEWHYCYYHAADENGTPIFVRENDFCSYGKRKDGKR